MKLKNKFIVIGLLCSVLLCACGDKSAIKNEITTPWNVESSGETTAEIITETPTEAPKDPVITGIDTFKEGQKLNLNADTSLLAQISFDARVDDRYFEFFDLSLINGELILSYCLIERGPDYDRYSEMYDFSKDKYETHLARLDKTNYSIIEDITVEGNYNYTLHTNNGIWVYNSFSEGLDGFLYNEKFEVVYTVDKKELTSGYYSGDNEFYYYIDNGIINQYCFATSITTKVDFGMPIQCERIENVYTDAEGKDYLMFYGMFGDLKSYFSAYCVDSSELLYSRRQDEYSHGYAFVQNDIYVILNNSDINGQSWELYGSNINSVKYLWALQDEYIDLSIMSNGNSLFYRNTDGVMEYAVFDNKTNQCIANSAININVDDGWGHYIMRNIPIVLDNGKILFIVSDGNSMYYFYEWNMTNNSGDWDVMGYDSVLLILPDVPEIPQIYDPTSFEPGELKEELKPLLKKVHTIEEKYGIIISIGAECQSIMGGYAVCALEDYNLIDYALDSIDAEFAKYPDGFINQISYSGYDTIHLYIAGTLVGIGDGLDYAGGFQGENGNETYIVLDCNENEPISVNINHEFCHVIDDFVQYKDCIDAVKWNSFNPVTEEHDDWYTYDYSMFGFEGSEIYTYDMGGQNNSICYYVDNYSMTYPTEDRARLWENIMMGEAASVNFETAPILIDKLNYYAECIRQAFDTTGWENVVWEKYIN